MDNFTSDEVCTNFHNINTYFPFQNNQCPYHRFIYSTSTYQLPAGITSYKIIIILISEFSSYTDLYVGSLWWSNFLWVFTCRFLQLAWVVSINSNPL